MKIHWTDTSLDQLSAIHDYMAQVSENYAKRIVDRLIRRSQQVGTFPQSGRIVPEFETKQIREVLEGHYRIIYYIKPDQIDILAIIHGSRQILTDKSSDTEK